MSYPLKERVDYIDAFRGFVMLLVVMWHTKLYYRLPPDCFSLNDVFFLLIMPAFFFICGYVCKGKEALPTKDLLKWMGRKFLVFLLPSILFMLLRGFLWGWSVQTLIFDVSKGGFWFTIILPFFYLFFTIIILFGKKTLKLGDTAFGVVHLVIGLLIYLGMSFLVSPYNPLRNDDLNGLFSVVHLRNYLFFSIGITAAKNHSRYLKWCENDPLSAILIGLFLTGCILYFRISDKLMQTLLIIFLGSVGTHILFTCFYKYQTAFKKTTAVGKALQYIGVRTMDIYLLHLFILPVNTAFIGQFFAANPNPLLELTLTFCISALVIFGCLVLSKIIRTSDILGKLLFGKVI